MTRYMYDNTSHNAFVVCCCLCASVKSLKNNENNGNTGNNLIPYLQVSNPKHKFSQS